MKNLDLLHVALVIGGLLVGVRLVQFVLVFHHVLRLRWQENRVSLVNASAVPEYVMEGLQAPLKELESLGFEGVGWMSIVSALYGSYSKSIGAWMFHAETRTYASVIFSGDLEPAFPYVVTFRSFSDSGNCLQTVNGTSHLFVIPPPRTLIVDPCTPTLKQQWQGHVQALVKHSFGAITLSSEQATQWLDSTAQEEFRTLRVSGAFVSVKGWYYLTWRRAWQIALRVVQGSRRASQMRAAQKKVLGAGVPLPPLEEELRAHLRQDELTRAPTRRNFYLWVFVATLLLFTLSIIGSSSFEIAAALLVALMLHEYGHYIAMRKCGYQDTTIFFIPFIGGVATGKKQNVSVSQEMLILLAGPVPGIILAFTAALMGAMRIPGAEGFFVMVIMLNIFNLLPILPLDGGRIVQLLLFARSPALDVIARTLAVGAFGTMAITLNNSFFVVLALVMLASVPQGRRQSELLRAVQRLPGSPDSEQKTKQVIQTMRELGLGRLAFTNRAALVRATLAQWNRTAKIGCLGVLGWFTVYAMALASGPVAMYEVLQKGSWAGAEVPVARWLHSRRASSGIAGSGPTQGGKYSDEEWNRVLRFFDHAEPELAAFAQFYGLGINKYYHDSSSWNFRFQHPKGGIGSIDLDYDPKEDVVSISSSWYIDDYDQGTRYLRWSEAGKRQVDERFPFRPELARELTSILIWDRGQMSPHGGMREIWHRHTREEFDRMNLRVAPVPQHLDALPGELDLDASSQ